MNFKEMAEVIADYKKITLVMNNLKNGNITVNSAVEDVHYIINAAADRIEKAVMKKKEKHDK